MDLRTRFTDELKAAMRAHDAARVSILRMITAKLKDTDIAARPGPPADDAAIVSMLRGMAKSRTESVAMYRQGGREELAAVVGLDKVGAVLAQLEAVVLKRTGDFQCDLAGGDLFIRGETRSGTDGREQIGATSPGECNLVFGRIGALDQESITQRANNQHTATGVLSGSCVESSAQ